MKKQFSYGILIQPMLLLMSLSTITVLGWVWICQSPGAEEESFQAYPTGIPWIDNEADCQNSGRTWQDNICWDSEHNPIF
jgi:hypothetical protein